MLCDSGGFGLALRSAQDSIARRYWMHFRLGPPDRDAVLALRIALRQWSGWESLGGASPGGPGAVRQTGGRLVVFVRGTDDTIYHRWQMTSNGDW